MAVLAVLLAVSAVFWVAAYFYARKKHNYWAERGVAHHKPTPFVGNLSNVLRMKQSIYDLLSELYFKYPNEVLVGLYGFTKPMVVIRDLDIIKDVLIKNFDSFVNRNFHCDELGEPLASELMFGRRDDEWRRYRQKSTTLFTSGKLREMYPLIEKVGKDLDRLCARTTAVGGEKQVDVRNFSSRFAIDVITSCAFGSEGKAVDSPDKSVMFRVLGDVFQMTFKSGLAQNLMFFQRSVYSFLSRSRLGIKVFRKEVEDDMYRIVDQASKQRLEAGERRPDMLDLLVFSNEPEFEGVKKKAGVSFQILVGGSETSSTSIFFTMYELAKNPEVQRKLQREIRETLEKHGGEISYEVLNTMEYLDQVVHESLRLYPVLPFLDRVASKNYRVPGTNITIEKGTPVFIPVQAIQKDPTYFHDPEKFIPERFSKENANIPSMAYFPFGAGPRHCIGKRFALLTVRNFLLHFFKDYDVHLSEIAKGPLNWNKKNITLSVLNGMQLIITKSNN